MSADGPRPDPGEDSPGADDPPPGPLSFEPGDASEQQRWAHRRDPDLEPREPGAPEVAPPPRPRNAHSWLFGVVVAMILAYIGLNTLRNVGSVSRGVAPGQRLPPFALPLALGRLDGDANIATARGQGARGRRPACEVRGAEVLNACQLTQGAPAVVAFVATGEPRCAAQLDRLERERRQFAGVRVAALAARTDRTALRREIRRRGWGFPVGYDRDGAVFARYGVVDCPTMVFAYPGGVAMRTTVKPLNDRELSRSLQRLVSGSKRRGWKPPAPA